MEEFYKKLKDKIATPPAESTDWTVWDKVERKMDEKNNDRLIPMWLWLPATLIVTGLLGYYLGSSTAHQFTSKHSISNTTIHDTIFIEQLVSHTDTIYTERIVERWRAIPKATLAEVNKLKSEIMSLSIAHESLNSKLELYKTTIGNHPIANNLQFSNLPGLRDYIIEQNIKTDFENLITSDRNSLSIAQLERKFIYGDLIYNRKTTFPVYTLSTEDLIKLKPQKTFLELITPDYINVGLSIDAPMFSINQEGEVGFEVGYALRGEILFSKRFSIITGVHNRSNKTTITDKQRAMDHPQPPQIATEEVFEKLDVASSYIDIPLLAKYKIKTGSIFDQYILAGVALSMPGELEYKYEYKSANTETYYEVKEEGASINFGYGVIGFGLEYNASERINLFGEGYLRYVPGTIIDRDKYHGIGFRFGGILKI